MDDKRRPFNNQYGFTLLEIVIAGAVLAIGAAVGAWSVNQILPDLRIKSAIRNLKSDMNNARLRAVRENRVVTLLFDTVNEEYSYFLDNGDGGVTAGDGVQEGSEPTLKTAALPRGVNMYETVFGVNTMLRFNGLGRAIEGGRVYLSINKGGIASPNIRYRGVTVSLIGKVNVNASNDGSNWFPVK